MCRFILDTINFAPSALKIFNWPEPGPLAQAVTFRAFDAGRQPGCLAGLGTGAARADRSFFIKLLVIFPSTVPPIEFTLPLATTRLFFGSITL